MAGPGVAEVAGTRREDDLLVHPPRVGRARDLGAVKELFHACAEDARARLVMVVGEAGIGKTRVAEEFQAYVDGLPGTVWWHSTRCPSYGDGVPLWAAPRPTFEECARSTSAGTCPEDAVPVGDGTHRAVARSPSVRR